MKGATISTHKKIISAQKILSSAQIKVDGKGATISTHKKFISAQKNHNSTHHDSEQKGAASIKVVNNHNYL